MKSTPSNRVTESPSRPPWSAQLSLPLAAIADVAGMDLERHAEDPLEQLALAAEAPQLQVDVATGMDEEVAAGTVGVAFVGAAARTG